MLSFEKFMLRDNPFRVVPAINAKELIWAGFGGIKEEFEKRIMSSLLIPNSAIVLNWGDYGSGKTHAARYFCKDSVTEKLAETVHCKKPLSMMINFPRGKKVIEEMYIQILDKIDIADLRASIPVEANITECIDNSTDNGFIRSVLKEMLANKERKEDQIKAFLYGTEYSKDLMNAGITRKLNIETDAVDLLSALFNVMTETHLYSAVILWIDEFEDITLQSSNGINAANSFIKILLDKTPNRLLIFINFTLTAIASMESLADYLQEGVKSRIVKRYELAYPNREDMLEYISDLMNHPLFRTTPVQNRFMPFEEVVVNQIINDLGSVSLRKYNEAFSRLLDLAALEDQETIDMQFYSKHKDEIITEW